MRSVSNTVAVAVTLALLAACAPESASSVKPEETATSLAGARLNILAFAGEMPQAVIDAFEDETGAQVTLDSSDSNETMIARLASGGPGYDIVEPSQYAVQQMIGQGLLAELDHSQLDGLENIAESFVDPSYDPGNKFSIPWVWGTTGLLFNTDCTGGPVDSWEVLFDEEFTGRIYMLDNMLAAYIVGLQVNGFSAASTDEDEIAVATETLIEQRPLLAGYNSTNYAELVARGDACVSQAWGGSSTAEVVASNDNVEFVMPVEGGSMWTGNLAIVEGSSNTDAAYEFLRFTLRPDIAALATDEGALASANQAAMEAVQDQDLLSNSAIYAPADTLTHADFIVDPGEAMAYFQRGWTRVRAS